MADVVPLCALDGVSDEVSIFMMRVSSQRGCGLDTYSVEAVLQAVKTRGCSPRERSYCIS